MSGTWSSRRPRVNPRRDFAAYPLAPIIPSRNSLDSRDELDEGSDHEMSRLPIDESSRSTSAHSSVRRGRSYPRQAPYLPLPSDVSTNPDSAVSEQAAELIHEFVHPHHRHPSRENLLDAEEELGDEVGGNAPVIAKELEEMRARVWWRRPSALWYAFHILTSAYLNQNHHGLRSHVMIRV